jgi:hypothetical protein
MFLSPVLNFTQIGSDNKCKKYERKLITPSDQERRSLSRFHKTRNHSYGEGVPEWGAEEDNGLKRDEIIGKRRRLHNEELYNL